jgi:hypothetical protein
MKHCPHLKELTIPIPRTCGDKDEVAIYRAIALPHLQHINIILDARNPDFFEDEDTATFDESEVPTDPDFDAWDNEFLDDWAPEQGVGPRKGHIRKAFINSAIDSTLVESIFWLIDGAKPAGSFPLEEVRFATKPGGFTGSGVTSAGVGDLCNILGKSWIVRRNPRDDRRYQVDSVPWSADLSKFRSQHRSTNKQRVLDEWGTIRAPFRKLWPSSRAGYDGPEGWEEDWKSFPLAV